MINKNFLNVLGDFLLPEDLATLGAHRHGVFSGQSKRSVGLLLPNPMVERTETARSAVPAAHLKGVSHPHSQGLV